ncbi:MAG: hypothetical protein WB787_04830 [Candidatus Acidiferrales bacterium]|jgi:hypothetical protein
MRVTNVCLAVALCGLIALGACTRRLGSGGSLGSGSSAPFTLAISSPFTIGTVDNPPSGVTVISFRIMVTGAVLQPGNVSLITTPQTIELTQLQTDNFILGTTNVPTGNYTSLDLTLANPDMTIYNGAGSVANCAVGTICELQPTLTVSSVTLSPAVTISANAPAGAELELSVNDSLQPDLSFNPSLGLTFVDLPSVASSAVLLPLNTVAGVVTSIGTNQFAMTTTSGANLTIGTTSNTLYSFPSTVCSADDFTCLAIGQFVSADLNVLGSGSFQANDVIFEDSSGEPGFLGTIAAIDATANPPQFTLVIHGQAPATSGIATNNVATVSLQNLTTYLIDADDLTIPSGYTFASTSDFVVGQEVLVRGNTVNLTPVTNQPSIIAISTNQVVLRQSQWTANVGLANNSGTDAFTLTSLPNLFTDVSPTAITNLYVVTSAQTVFVNSSLTGVTPGTPLTAKGLIFSNIVNPVSSPSDVASIIQGAPNFQPATTRRAKSSLR